MTKIQTKIKTEPFGGLEENGRWADQETPTTTTGEKEGEGPLEQGTRTNKMKKVNILKKQNITRSLLRIFFHDFHTHLAYID